MDKFKDKIQLYFEQIAPDLDRWSDRNRYYYRDIQKLHQYLVPKGSKVLEVGCGTGSLLAAVKPSLGVGIDFSPSAIEIAKDKSQTSHQESQTSGLSFYCLDAETLTPEDLNSEKFDFILLAGVLGYLNDIQSVLDRLQAFCHPRTRIVLVFHNYQWEGLLHFAELIGQRRPQPPQNWLSQHDVLNLLMVTGYSTVKIGKRFLFPKWIPLLANFINRYICQLPIIDNLNLTNYIIARPSISSATEAIANYSVTVVIPARNEAGNIQAAVDRMPALGKHTEIIFVEGHSQDNTWEEIQRVVVETQRVEEENGSGQFSFKIMQQKGKGKADAVRLGFAEATGDILMILDADLTVQPEDLPQFVQVIALGRGEFINGSRLVYPRSGKAMPWLNTLANKFFARAFSYLLGQSLKDTLCGTKVLWRSDYERIVANRSYFGDFDPFGDFDLLFGAAKLGLHIVEVPVRYQPRTYGQSNIAHFKEGLVLLRMCLYAAQKIKFI
ncbi:glycosyltransferase [Tumidithrix elongata RA019]|uniref:Glycosyltransferase n=1 Tax=Tumidithrix elongata BACA0141 TaxID=2716417 RepID=A0AAW9PQ67_9CYAN|nr:glycosyltransferase [Tumidithrix elongata RA019]